MPLVCVSYYDWFLLICNRVMSCLHTELDRKIYILGGEFHKRNSLLPFLDISIMNISSKIDSDCFHLKNFLSRKAKLQQNLSSSSLPHTQCLIQLSDIFCRGRWFFFFKLKIQLYILDPRFQNGILHRPEDLWDRTVEI